MKKSAWQEMQDKKAAGTLPEPPARRHQTLTRWFAGATGAHDLPGHPIPKSHRRHLDRWCHKLTEGTPAADIRELREDEFADHPPCLSCTA
jgi:hypothetical protein